MLSVSSAMSFLQGSSTPTKRDKPHDYDDQTARPKPRVSAPFLDDSDDDSEAEKEAAYGEPSAKRRMLQPTSTDSPVLDNDRSEERPANAAGGENATDAAIQQLEQSRDAQDGLPSWSSQRPLFSRSLFGSLSPSTFSVQTCDGTSITIKQRKTSAAPSYESMVASRSKTKEGRAKRSYYGIDIHELMGAASKEIANKKAEPASSAALPSIEVSPAAPGSKSKKTLLWTEKYRARTFMDLCGDDGTNRLVLRWLKKWDSLVFPGAAKSKPVIVRRPGASRPQGEEEKPHRKILMLTGPPGLGKTTLAHVCARQAGYEVMEINASDDRSRDVVRNRIRTSLGTESVKNISNSKDGNGPRKVAKPVCVVVDEVDGVVSGSGGAGEGGFVKALIDLVNLDERNSAASGSSGAGRRKKKEDDFRLMRPIILICNDVYHPSLRPLRQSNLAEIIHVGRPTIDAAVGRLKAVFEKEAIPCDKDAARKLCEAAWGMSSGIDAKRGVESTVQGDLRGVMVVGEWVAGRFRSSTPMASGERLTRQWIERNVLHDLANGAAGARGLGRGSVRDIVTRLFQEGGGFPKQAMDLSGAKNQHEQPKTELGFGEQHKKYAMERLAQMAETSGEISYILNEVFAEYPNREFNDDCYLTKPNQAYDWLHFHDACQARLYASQEWELAPYLCQPVLACHHLFASPKKHVISMGYDKRWGDATAEDAAAAPLPFSGPRADFQAHEAERENRAQLQAIQAQLSPTLGRLFRSAEDVATEFLPYLVRLVAPDVKPVTVGGSAGATASVRKDTEKAMVKRASEVLAEVGIALHKGRIEGGGDSFANRAPEYVYRMEPDLDALSTFETASNLISSQAPTRYAVRQVLDQELQRTMALRDAEARRARFTSGAGNDAASSAAGAPPPPTPFDNKENLRKMLLEEAKLAPAVKKDFFGRVIEVRPLAEVDGNSAERRRRGSGPNGDDAESGAAAAAAAAGEAKVWVTFHEGLNNAVRKPLSLQDFLRGM